MKKQLAVKLEKHLEETDGAVEKAHQFHRAQIMIVDDEPITMEVVKTFLEDFGYQNFLLVEDSSQAVRVLLEKQPDILLLDLVMPGKNGFEILEEVRRHPELKHLPVVVLTSSTDKETRLRALDLGATDFLSKPVDPSELVLRVRNTIQLKVYQDQLAFCDPLTNLPNRRMFIKKLDSAFARAQRSDEQFVLLDIEIDRFDKFSDMFGTRILDQVIVSVARRIEGVVRGIEDQAKWIQESEVQIEVYRPEGGEFSLLLYGIREIEDAAKVADRLCSATQRAITISNEECQLTISIGIAGYPGDSPDSSCLLKQAKSARDFARAHGGGRFQFASREINARYTKRLNMGGQPC